MKKVKTWWLEVGFPWIKEYWWVLLILPLILLAFIGCHIYRPEVVDPVKRADRRAKKEKERRTKELNEENAHLNENLDQLKARKKKERALGERAMEDKTDQLRSDPEALKNYMLESRGKK